MPNTTLQQAVDNAAGPLLAAQPDCGLVVGVLVRDERCVFVYGKGQTAGSQPLDAHSVFDIGSITKVFTTGLLSSMAHDGLVTLDDRIGDLLPETPEPASALTLRELATHTSGLPRLPRNIVRAAMRNPQNPYAAYTTADVMASLAAFAPQPAQGPPKIGYSTLGMGLLGLALARRLGMDYEQAVAGRLCEPLGLSDTRITLNAEQAGRQALAHAANGKRVENWRMGSLEGGGALRSTASDLLAFLHANVAENPPLPALLLSHEQQASAFAPPGGYERRVLGALSLLHRLLRTKMPTPRYDPEQLTTGIGLGWLAGRVGGSDKLLHWHNGGTTGARSFAGFVKETQTGVVVLHNRGMGDRDLLFPKPSVDDIGFEVLHRITV